ncbi:MAG TPA: helix-turn-helix domain-containing protein [Puia sp.]|nr:helix-turn-helix domain-containing protein [Puia sp.]
MDRNSFPMDNLIRFDPLTLRDAANGELSLAVAGFDAASLFAEPRQEPYFSILLVRRGAGKAIRDGAAFTFSAPCLLCFSIYQPYSLAADGVFEGVLLNFHPGFFCLFEHRREVSCNGVLFNNLYDTPVVELGADVEALLTIALQMRDELGRPGPADRDVLLSFLKVFLIHASRVKLEQQADGSRQAAPILGELTSAIETHYRTHHQAGDYEQLLHVSAAVLNKASKQYFGKTLTALIAERLIIEAKRQLYLTAKAVKEIAFELGYSDEFYFSRFFKKNVGVSPQVFRETVGYDKFVA